MRLVGWIAGGLLVLFEALGLWLGVQGMRRLLHTIRHQHPQQVRA